jgi:hypothetical protein
VKKQLYFTAAPPCCCTAHCEKTTVLYSRAPLLLHGPLWKNNYTLQQRLLAATWHIVKK